MASRNDKYSQGQICETLPWRTERRSELVIIITWGMRPVKEGGCHVDSIMKLQMGVKWNPSTFNDTRVKMQGACLSTGSLRFDKMDLSYLPLYHLGEGDGTGGTYRQCLWPRATSSFSEGDEWGTLSEKVCIGEGSCFGWSWGKVYMSRNITRVLRILGSVCARWLCACRTTMRTWF